MNTYQSPLSERYASSEILKLFSPHVRHVTWRSLWIALAKAQKTLGLPITDAQIQAMVAARDRIDEAKAAAYEKQFRHDVMAHVHAYGDQCPVARGIIHLGATSCYVTDNGDLILMREGLKLLLSKLVQLIRQLSSFAEKYADLPCLSYTHFQAAQPTTVGKRACLWLQDFLWDLKNVERLLRNIRFLGAKGATGTQASFLSLFDGDHEKVKELDRAVAQEMGFSSLFPISGQTYPRKQDVEVLQTLSSFAASAHKMATDVRLLSHLKELEEPFAEQQIGSSAMPYKRNPMRAERICALARFLISLQENPLYTEATQWLERTLDDSANRRLVLPEAYLTADALLNLLLDLTSGLHVYPAMIRRHLDEELPFLATEPLLMAAVKRGKDRQVVHALLRTHSLRAAAQSKEKGEPCDLLQWLKQEKGLGLTATEIEEIVKVEHFVGRAGAQVKEFLHSDVFPCLASYAHLSSHAPSIEL